MGQDKNRPFDLSPYLFWDIDIASLNSEKHAAYIIDRVLSLGTMEDFRRIISGYGVEKIKEVIINLRYLDDTVLHFCSLYFTIPLSDFRCYTNKQLTPAHWQY